MRARLDEDRAEAEAEANRVTGPSPPSRSSGADDLRASLPSFDFSELSGRYQVILGIAIAFVICNMERVHISVAVIPMAEDYGWTPTQAGLIQSAFFYGYLLAQLPGGWLANKFGGEKVLPFGVFL